MVAANPFTPMMRILLAAVCVAMAAGGAAAAAPVSAVPAGGQDWPQWRGAKRDGVWRETGLREQFGPEALPRRWTAEIGATLARQKEAMAPRLYPTFPDRKYICFYPMDRLRGEINNWYSAPIEERQRMMHEHGLVGRRYADEVKQIITGSIGLDDWEWGVELFADDPLVFKRLIYEMRFDEVSAKYAKFGQFFVGVLVPSFAVEQFLIG